MERNDIGPLEAWFNGEPASKEQITSLENHALFLLEKVELCDVQYQYTLNNPDGTIITFLTEHSERKDDEVVIPATARAGFKLAYGSESNPVLEVKFGSDNLPRVFLPKAQLGELGDTTSLIDPRRSYSDDELAAIAYIQGLIKDPTPGKELIQRNGEETTHIANVIRSIVADNTVYGLRTISYTKQLADGSVVSVKKRQPFGLHELAEDLGTIPMFEVGLTAIDSRDQALTKYQYERLYSGFYDVDSYPLPKTDNPAIVSEDGRLLMSPIRVEEFRENIGLRMAGRTDVNFLIQALFDAATQRV